VIKPPPQVGLVIRYDFLWSHERDRGQDAGTKDRPCVVVTAITRAETGETHVLVAPITHAAPRDGDVAIEIPTRLGRHLGLDDDRSFIVADEANTVSWDDPGIVPAIPGERWAYGRLPWGLYQSVRDAILGMIKARRLKTADRTD
jgi:mRNA-degrading endonuclease toxin of MazEF toxin-antitoxin module